MALLVLGFLILLGLPRDSVSQPEERAISRVCGSDRVELYGSPEGLSFFVNEKRLEGSLLICEALGFYFGSGCFGGGSEANGWRRIGEEFCGRGLGSDFHLSLGRKVRRLETDASITKWLSTKGEEKRQEYNFSVKHPNMAITVPGMFLLCCSFICPCFRAKKKDPSEQHVLAKELNQTDSVSSIEVSSALVKVTATPPRGPPGTPPRVPPGTPPRAPPGTPSRVPPSPSRFSLSPQLNRIGSIHLSVNQIYKATQNFSPSLKLGGGGFGTVYKAELPGGQVVAIKKANKEHFSALRDEFSNEVELLAKIEHRNLVKLLGYTDKGNERIIITEYVPNGTLREHLDGQYGKILDFHQRLEIAIDVAHGLTYLHLYAEKTIIHRDVKSSNILLTESYRAKVSDFGLARTGPMADQTHIMTRVKGTAGYLDPEYLKTFQLTPKSDVFSFGILLVEIISGRRPVDLRKHPDERITIRWAFNKFTEGNPKEILDPLLEEVDGEVLSKILSLAFQCAAPTRSDRPTMKEVGEQLWEIRKEYGRSRSRV